MKKPSSIQIFFAKTWLWSLAFWVCPVIIGVIILMPFYSNLQGFSDFVLAIASAAVFGFFCTQIPLFSLSQIRMKINGAPFRQGDTVHILAGKHKGETACVYDVWKDRNQIRVDLGDQAKEDVKDVYSYLEVCRKSSDEHIA